MTEKTYTKQQIQDALMRASLLEYEEEIFARLDRPPVQSGLGRSLTDGGSMTDPVDVGAFLIELRQHAKDYDFYDGGTSRAFSKAADLIESQREQIDGLAGDVSAQVGIIAALREQIKRLQGIIETERKAQEKWARAFSQIERIAKMREEE